MKEVLQVVWLILLTLWLVLLLCAPVVVASVWRGEFW